MASLGPSFVPELTSVPLGIATLLFSSNLKCIMTPTSNSPLFPHWVDHHPLAPQVILVGSCMMVHCFYPCILLMINLINLSSLNSSTTVFSHSTPSSLSAVHHHLSHPGLCLNLLPPTCSPHCRVLYSITQIGSLHSLMQWIQTAHKKKFKFLKIAYKDFHDLVLVYFSILIFWKYPPISHSLQIPVTTLSIRTLFLIWSTMTSCEVLSNTLLKSRHNQCPLSTQHRGTQKINRKKTVLLVGLCGSCSPSFSCLFKNLF